MRSQTLGELRLLLGRVSGGFPEPGSGCSWLQVAGIEAVRREPPTEASMEQLQSTVGG